MSTKSTNLHVQHVTVYREPGRFAAWPANYGIWSWGDEIVVAFTAGYYDAAGGFHAKDRNRPFTTLQARSTNGGHTWHVQDWPGHAPGNRGFSADEHLREDLRISAILQDDPPKVCPSDVEFTHPDFAILFARTGLRAGATSWFYVSSDRCHTWQGPYRLPMFDLPGISARTDAVVLGPKQMLVFLTAVKPNGLEGRVFCARTDDAGASFQFVSWVTPEPAGFTIMPSTVHLPSGRWVCAVRCAAPKGESTSLGGWIDLYASDDLGVSWRFMHTVTHTGTFGNPPAMLWLRDGRLCMAYGFRNPPFGMRARFSADDGATWSEEVILRDDGGDADLGYPRMVQRSDGRLVTVYYFVDSESKDRHIAATIWDVPGMDTI